MPRPSYPSRCWVVLDRVIFNVVVPLTLGHVTKRTGITILILLGVLKTPEWIGV